MKRYSAASLALILTVGSQGFARTLWENPSDSNESLALHSALKATFLQTTAHLEPADTENSSIEFGRLRVEPVYRTHELVFDAAYDNQVIEDNNSVSALSVLPSTAPAQFRLNEAGGEVFQNNHSQDYGELDRASVSYQKNDTQITVGRQAIGWGRGTVFSAVDIFSPFTPFQFDREWKRGVDAFLAETKVSEHMSAEIVYSAAPRWDDSALGGRLRGAFDKFDYEFLLAKRAQDTMWAVTTSAPAKGAEVHAEFAVFKTPEDFPSTGLFGNRGLVPKGVLGISNNFNIGNGISAALEYHYSGFGASSAAEFNEWMLIPAYQNRVAQGDTQIYGDQALAFNFGYTFNEKWQVSLENLSSLVDSSGAFVPSATWDFSESSSLLATALLFYGASPSGLQLNSQFGSSAQIVIVQVRIYD